MLLEHKITQKKVDRQAITKHSKDAKDHYRHKIARLGSTVGKTIVLQLPVSLSKHKL